MQRCLFLAKKGLGTVAPNPMVGAVLVYNDEIISEGYTSPYGGPHAEVNAISKVKDKSILEKCTLFVSLEPCAHFGKTPPCANLIVDSKIPKVVIGAIDTFSEVDGKGIEYLEKNGVSVTHGVLEEECRELNRRFFTFHERHRPFIVLKWAQSSDGFMDISRKTDGAKVNWITQPETKSLVHLWRSQEMGILVGRKTIENDNPRLDVRLVDGKSPIRLVIDPNLKINLEHWSHRELSPTIIFNSIKNETKGNVEWIKLTDFSLENILQVCFKQNIQSIFVEGGAKTLKNFIQKNLWDEARIFIGQTNLKEGLPAPVINQVPKRTETLNKDVLKSYSNT